MSRHRPGILVERDTVGRRRNTDKFVSYTNANKEGAGNDVNRARFRFFIPLSVHVVRRYVDRFLGRRRRMVKNLCLASV